MKKNKIKNTDLEVTELSFGTSSLGSMPDTYGYEVPEERAQETLKRFFKGPVNLLDTSRNYGMGESELRIGRAIKNNSGWPNNFILSTKLDRDMNTLGFDKDRARKSLEETRRQLQESTGLKGIFENTTPLASGGSPTPSGGGGHGALRDMDPNDPGVDITGLMNIAGGAWKQIK